MIHILLITAKVVFGLLVVHLTVLSITLYLHRGQTHGSVVLSPSLAHFFKCWLWFACGMNAESQKEWVGVHRLHHAETDTDDDPHNPAQKGPWKLFLFAFFYYRQSVQALRTKSMPSGENQFVHYTRGMTSDYKLDTFLNKMPPLSGLVLGLCLYSWLFGWPGFVIWILQTLWMPVVAGGVINVLGHTVGHVDYPCDDSSRSLAPQKKGIFSWIQVVLLNWGTGGEHLHNPHHAHAGSARFGSGKGLNFDIGYWWLVQLNKIGLVVKMNVHEEKRLI